MASIKETTGYTLAKACRARRGNVGEPLAEVGLHVGREMVLIELWEQDGLRGGELAEKLGVEPPTITKTLRRLEGCGLVERRQELPGVPHPRRSLPRRTRCWERVEEGTFAGMSVGERRNLRRLLTKVRANLDPNFATKR